MSIFEGQDSAVAIGLTGKKTCINLGLTGGLLNHMVSPTMTMNHPRIYENRTSTNHPN